MKTVTIEETVAKQILAAPKKALKSTYPKSNEGYAVALSTASGKIYPGVSDISDSQTLTMHSEATALERAAIHEIKDIVAITGPNCHACKQLLWESSLNSGIDIQIVTEVEQVIECTPISELMPQPWPDKEGNK